MRHRKIFNSIKQRGQMLVFFALMIPIILLFVGLAFDLGWYYLNVSRLQNAADAAALAGAKAITTVPHGTSSEESSKYLGNDYYNWRLIDNKLPADILEYENISNNDYAFGILQNYLNMENLQRTLEDGGISVEEYVRKNLQSEGTLSASNNGHNFSVTDGWSLFEDKDDGEVQVNVELYARRLDIKNDIQGSLYYVVELKETIRHFFLPGWFDDMLAPVRAVVLLKPHDNDLLSAMEYLERTEVIDNWEHQNYYKYQSDIYSGNWNHYQDSSVHYRNNNTYRTESVTVKQNDATSDNSSGTSANNPIGTKGYKYKISEVDSINIDFRAETLKQFTTDWDIGQSEAGLSYNFTDGWGQYNAADKRVLFTANFDTPYDTRYPSTTRTDVVDPDVLWVRIESDPIKSLAYIPGKSGHKAYDSVRQITLNFNKSNKGFKTISVGGEQKKIYKYRPLCIFYTGPEHVDYATDSDENAIRKSQPVVVNFYADYNAILFFPNSPVIINGWNNTWTGFIIAKEFVAAKRISDITDDGYKQVTDSNNNTIFVKWENTLTKNYVDNLNSNYTNATDSTGNIVSFLSSKPHYTNAVKIKNDNSSVSVYATISELCDVTNAPETENIIPVIVDKSIQYVDSTTLTDTKNNSNKIQVTTMDGKTKYASSTFPTVVIGGSVKYVDALTLTDTLTATNTIPVTTMGGEIKYASYVNKGQNKQYSTPVATDGGQVKYIASNKLKDYKENDYLAVTDYGGDSYSVYRGDIEKTYRKVTLNGEDKYIEENNTTYYQLVPGQNYDKTGFSEDYTIVDQNGNIQTKALPPNSTYKNTYNPEDSEWNKIIHGNEYRTEEYEVIYKMSAFNISASKTVLSEEYTSAYSSFKIPILQRKNYKYLDSDTSVDMFFTTRRARWVD